MYSALAWNFLFLRVCVHLGLHLGFHIPVCICSGVVSLCISPSVHQRGGKYMDLSAFLCMCKCLWREFCDFTASDESVCMSLCICEHFCVHHLSLCVSVPVLVCLLTSGHIPRGVCVYLVWERTVCVVWARVVCALGVLLLWCGMPVLRVCVWIAWGLT